MRDEPLGRALLGHKLRDFQSACRLLAQENCHATEDGPLGVGKPRIVKQQAAVAGPGAGGRRGSGPAICTLVYYMAGTVSIAVMVPAAVA